MRAQAAVADHCRNASLAQSGFHARAGVAQSGGLKQGFTNLKTLMPQGVEIDPADHQIAAQQGWINAVTICKVRYLLNEFL